MTDPKDFLLNTDYEMDKIVYFTSGEFTKTTTFSHGLQFAPLIFGVWSTDKDFKTSNTLGMISGSVDPNDNYPLGVFATVEGIYSHPESESKIKLTADGTGADNTKIYYRIYAFEPPEYTGSTPKTSKDAKQFMLNTDYNYRKIKAKGEFTQSGQEYAHNLGYYPHVMAWIKWKTYYDETGYEIDPFVYSSDFNGVYFTVTENKISATFPTGGWVDKVYWRIYHDET